MSTYIAPRCARATSADPRAGLDRNNAKSQYQALAAFILKAGHADGNFYPGSTLKNNFAVLFAGSD